MTEHGTGHIHLRIISGAFLVTFLCVGMLAIVPDNSSAASFPKNIWGYVYEGDTSHPVVGAVVVVKTYDGSNNLRQTLTDPGTDSTGMYTVSTTDDWALVATIEVTATYGGTNQDTVSVADNDGPSQRIDVPFPYAIPQLAGIGGMLAAVGAIGAVAVVSLRSKRRQTV
jgi:hypothetical protein